MKTLLTLLMIVIVFPCMGYTDSTHTNTFDIMWSFTSDGYSFRQISYLRDSPDKRYTLPEFFAYQVPKDDGTNFSEFAVGGFYKPMKGSFTLNTGAYIMFSEDGMYFAPALSPKLNVWRFMIKVFCLQYIPFTDKGHDQSVVFPLAFYLKLGTNYDIQIGMWNTWYDAEGSEESETRIGPSVCFTNSLGESKIHVHRRDPQSDWAVLLRHSYLF